MRHTGKLMSFVLVSSEVCVLAACGSGEGSRGPEGESSRVALAVTNVPGTVSCIQVSAAPIAWGVPGSPIATQTFSPSPGASWSGSLALGTFTAGTLQVTAFGYGTACAGIAGTTPTWVADPVNVDVAPGVYDVTTLTFRENFGIPVAGNFAPSIVQVSTGRYGTGVRLPDGSVRMYGSYLATPFGLTGAKLLAVGLNHACVAKTDNTVWCWGENAWGQLGDGTTTSSFSTPVQVTALSGIDIKVLAAGDSTACASSLYSTWCWGYNTNGAVGDGTTTHRSTPQYTGNGGSIAISTNGYETCAVGRDGRARCWGYNGFGQLGNGTTTDSLNPADVNAPVGMVDISTGGYHACAVHASGKTYCWGYNAFGQLGNGTTTSSSLPVEITSFGSSADHVAAGNFHTCIRTSEGAVACVGDNSTGQIGDGTGATQLSPVVVFPFGVEALSGQSNSNCVLAADNTLWCWGQNEFGQFMDGTAANKFEPVQAKL